MRLPRAWTDADGEVVASSTSTRLTVESIRELITILDALEARC